MFSEDAQKTLGNRLMFLKTREREVESLEISFRGMTEFGVMDGLRTIVDWH